MTKKILVTGGAGFIGSHLIDRLIQLGHSVRSLDSLEKQVHGKNKPDYLNPQAEYLWGNVLDAEALEKALQGAEAVFYFAASVGVGQSMYEIERYVKNNTYAASVFLQKIIDSQKRPQKIIVASSMSLYGEGAYHCDGCGPVTPSLRSKEQLLKKLWEMRCPVCKKELRPIPTTEEKQPLPTSVYAITKRDHEELFLSVGRAYGIPTVALRFFNIYGERQALSNPYTGALAIFSSRVLNGNPPIIFEDGLQTRDFIHVSDIVHANLLALETPRADYEIFNVGSGVPTSVLEVANKIQVRIGKRTGVQMVRQFRAGDIRHCFADVEKIRRLLQFQCRMELTAGIGQLMDWVQKQKTPDRSEQATHELQMRGLTQ